MKILLAGSVLADSSAGAYSSGLRFDGLNVVDAADILRSAAARFFPRGNAKHTVSFNVTREFATHVAAQKAAATVNTYTPKAGVLELQCGEAGETSESVFSANCVLAGVNAVHLGVSVFFTYSLQCGLLTTDEPPGFITPGETMIQAGIEDIPSGADSVPITFPTAFPGVGPVIVTASVLIPAGLDVIDGQPSEPSVGSTGFTQLLAAAAPASGYKVSWVAVQTS